MRSEKLYRVYRTTGIDGDPGEKQAELSDGYSMELWRPGRGSIVPPTMNKRFIAWWLFHRWGILGNRLYRVVLIRYQGAVVHRSCLVPKYFRWPFMGKNDLQISSTWTHPAHRGRGLATFALSRLARGYADGSRQFWYICREDNPASIAVCLRGGFQFDCLMRRTHPWGSLLFGRFLPVAIAEKTGHENLAADHR
jgi:RimJ/RimL family protein N-acetyltransferase